ncbi:MAG: ACT domain-containing protein [Acidobacteriota bacterium]
MRSLVMTLIGKDRPGLVGSLAAIIERHDGNWEESRMVRLAGEFAGLLQLRVPEDRGADLEAALGEIEGLTVALAKPLDEAADGDTHLLELDVVGQDHPGIVHKISTALAAREINVEELETEVFSAAMSAELMFRAHARLRAPKGLALHDLEAELEGIATDLMVEVRLDELDA